MSYTLNCKFHEAQTVCLNDVCLLNSAVIINIIPFVIVTIANIHYHTWSVRCHKVKSNLGKQKICGFLELKH